MFLHLHCLFIQFVGSSSFHRLFHATIAFHLICIDENTIRSLRLSHEYDETPSLPQPPPRDIHNRSLLSYIRLCLCVYHSVSVYINILPPHHSPTSIDDKCSCRRRMRTHRISFTFFSVYVVCIKKQHEWMVVVAVVGSFLSRQYVQQSMTVSTIPYWDRSRKIRINKFRLNFS